MHRVFSVFALGITLSFANYPTNSEIQRTMDIDFGSYSVHLLQSNHSVSFLFGSLGAGDKPFVSLNGENVPLDEENRGEIPMEIDTTAEALVGVTSPNSNPMVRDVIAKQVLLTPPLSGDSAIAQSTAATRTRIRYQTYIAESTISPPISISPSLSCFAIVNYVESPIDHFLGDSRSWNPNSDSFRTRFDAVLSWGDSPDVAPTVSVGPTTAVGKTDGKVWEIVKQASSDSMVLTTGVLSSDYISFNMKQNVANPFCPTAAGIEFNLSWYVKRNGVFTMKGFYKPVPRIEIYARDNVDTNWRTLFQNVNEQFLCLVPAFFSNTCKLDTTLNSTL